MGLFATPYRVTDASTKWGLVTVVSETGRVARQFRISGAIADAVARFERLPPGISDGEWRAGRVTVACRPCTPGQCLPVDEGWLALNAGMDESNPRQITVRLYFVPPGQWATEGEVVMLSQSVIAEVGGGPWPSPF